MIVIMLSILSLAVLTEIDIEYHINLHLSELKNILIVFFYSELYKKSYFRCN